MLSHQATRTTGRTMLLAAIVVAITGTAQAGPIELFLDPSFGSTEDTGATGSLILTFGENRNSDWMGIEIANTTSPDIGSRLTAVGFELPGFIEAPLSFTEDGEGAYFDVLTFDVDVSPSWIDPLGAHGLMLSSDGRFEGGNPRGAPRAGESQWVMVSLGNTGRTPVELEHAFRTFYVESRGPVAVVRFQSVGSEGEDSDKTVGFIPEPSTLALMSCSALALLERARRRPQ